METCERSEHISLDERNSRAKRAYAAPLIDELNLHSLLSLQPSLASIPSLTLMLARFARRYFPKVARKLLAVLEPLRIGVTVAIFSENPEHVLPTIVAVISDDFPGSDFKVVAHGEELNFLVAFGTFMAADVFVASVSSMSLIATFLAGDSLKPVVVAAPHVSGAENWAAGTLRADEEGNFEGGDVLEKVAREWMEERTKREGGQGRALGGASSLGHL